MRRACTLAATAALMWACSGCGRVAVRGERVREHERRLTTISYEIEPEEIPTRRPSADRGRPLFEQPLAGHARSCANCHGQGERPPSDPAAPDFRDPAWIRDKLQTDLVEHVAHHPSHDYAAALDLQGLWDVLAYARFNSTTAVALRDAGTEVFGKNCNVCHGNKGFGNGFLAPTMEPKPRNLTDYQAWGLQRTDREIFNNIQLGVAWSAMPPWRETLSPDEVWAAVDFIRSQQYDVPENEEPSGPTAQEGAAQP